MIKSVLTYAYPAWELLKLKRMQNKFLRTTGNFLRCTPVRDLQTVFNFLYVSDQITQFCRQQA
jgi:hypothetical protein